MKTKNASSLYTKRRGANNLLGIPIWLIGVALIGAFWTGMLKLPTQSIATSAGGLTQSCSLQAGQTLTTTITASALDNDKPDGLVTVTATGAIDGSTVSFVGATGTTQDKGSGVAVLLTNATTFSAKVTGSLPCDRDNVNLGALSGESKVGLTGGFTNTTINSAGTVAGNETVGASGVGFWTMRLTQNRTSAYTLGGTSTGYLTNPAINKFGLILDLNPGTSTCMSTLDIAQLSATYKGAACSQKAFKFSAPNGYDVGFECAGNLDIYGQGDVVFRMPAVSGQNPACYIEGRTLAYDYDIQNGQIVETPEDTVGVELNNGQAGHFAILIA